MTHLHIDAGVGAAGDMLLAALIDAGASLGAVREAVESVLPGAVAIEAEPCRRAGISATRVVVSALEPEPAQHRSWAGIRSLLVGAGLAPQVRDLSVSAFGALAEAEGAIHGVQPDDVHFHEVGALDSIADTVGVAAAVADLGVASVSCSRVGVGSGVARTAHGTLPVPVPAVTELLRGAPTWGGPLQIEACTPTAAALLQALARQWGPQPPMTVAAIGVGAGSYDDPATANVTRVFLGDRAGEHGHGEAWLLSTNVDDLDPRLWPHVIEELLGAGAADAWLTPILMKKGRPAHTLSVLVGDASMPAVRRAVVRQTSAIGMRVERVGKWALSRSMVTVEVLGRDVAVKIAFDAAEPGVPLNVQPEWEDVRRTAAATGQPAQTVLQLAIAAASQHWNPGVADGGYDDAQAPSEYGK